MKGIKRFIWCVSLILLVIDPIGFWLWEYDNFLVYAYEFNIWKYRVIYNPAASAITEQELNFIETHEFDIYVNEYNKQERINSIVSKLGYERIGIINTDNNYIYTIYLDNEGKIIKVVDGFDDVNFIAELSIARIERLTKQERFEDLPQEIKIPFKVKLKILKVMWL